ncbi:hypothetical protein AB1K70_11500 [Bremerella sp. JC770]|uniref:hypothetical protein n=1 Tax=Bremerella sp. JC770 TaxID=3232137 RepID=UPI00345A7F71
MGGSFRCQGPVGRGNTTPPSHGMYSDEVLRNAVSRYKCPGVEGMLTYCEREDAQLQAARAAYHKNNNPLNRFNRRAGMGGLARVYGPAMAGPFPVTGAIASSMGLDAIIDLIRAASDFVRKIIRAARAFMRGLKAGMQDQLSTEDFKKFGGKLAESSVVTVVFPLVFGAGAVSGIVNDVVDTVKGIVDLASNIREIASAAYQFLKEVLTDTSMAYELGKEVGKQLSSSFKTLTSRSTVRFTYELGKIVGPFIIYTLLAFFGFPQVAMVRGTAWMARFLTKFPKLAKVVRRMARIVPSRKGFVLYGRATKAYIRESGITKAHFNGFKAVAKEQKVIVVVRNTNPKSLDLIETHKCPPKAKNLEGIASTKTSDQGIVMAENVKAVQARGYAVVDDKLVARTKDGKAIDLPPNKFWKLEKGQVIDVDSKKPVVGDYDLMGVIDPAAPGRNIALVSSNGELVADVSSPIVRRLKDVANHKFDAKRVLHGAQDQYAGFRGGATVIYPDGHATYLPDDAAVKAFYDSPSILRQTRTGKYESGPRPTFDENGRYENVILGPWSAE